MRIWLDRALQCHLTMDKAIYYSVVFLGKNEELDEKNYRDHLKTDVDAYIKALPGASFPGTE